jgi:hypothetical protein
MEIVQIEKLENNAVSNPLPENNIQKKGAFNQIARVIREIVAALFWFYLIFKVFIFDLDIFLVDRYFPNYYWIVEYKFLVIISLLAMVWFFTKNKNIILWALYILFYPFIVIFWKLPFFVFKQKSWIFAFAVINSIISFFKSIKYKFIVSVVFLLSMTGIFISSNHVILWVACSLILAILLAVYIRSLIMLFKPSSIFQVYIKIFSGMRKHGKSFFGIDENMKNLPVENYGEKQLEKWTTNLQTSVLFNRVCLFSAKKLRDYQNSRLGAVSSIFTIFGLMILTIFSFAIINLGIFKINNGYFEITAIPHLFTFIYYSFNSIFFNSIKEIVPTSAISQSLSMIESLFAFFLAAIFISLIFTYKSQKRSDELNIAIQGIEEEAKDMEGFIRDEFKFNNIFEAMAELNKLKTGLAQFILKISESIK